MPQSPLIDSTDAFEQALRHSPDEQYRLLLYVAGTSPQSLRAIANIKKICEEHLQGRYELQVIDLYQQPQLALGEQIIAALAEALVEAEPDVVALAVGEYLAHLVAGEEAADGRS